MSFETIFSTSLDLRTGKETFLRPVDPERQYQISSVKQKTLLQEHSQAVRSSQHLSIVRPGKGIGAVVLAESDDESRLNVILPEFVQT